MEKGDILLIKKAISIELSRNKYYSKNAGKINNLDAKKVLNILARSERNHYSILSNNLSRFKSGKELLKVEKLVIGSSSNMPSRNILPSASDLDIIEISFKIEKKDPKIYADIIKKTKSSKLRVLFNQLKKQEESHLKYIERELNHLRQLSVRESEAKNPRMVFSRFVKRN